MKAIRTVIFALLIANAGACTNLANNLQDPAIWDKIGRIQDRYAEQDYLRNHAIFDLTGDWTFHDKSIMKANTIRHGNGGIMVIPVDGGKPVFYAEAGRNQYRSGKATYHFSSRTTAQWRSNDNRNMVINLRRITR